MKDTSGPAFPVLFVSQNNSTGETTMYQSEGGATLRDYFAMHAPDEPQPWFVPDMPQPPVEPSGNPIGNNGEYPDDQTARNLLDWRRDPVWDVEDEHPTYSYWAQQWRDYWSAIDRHSTECARQRYIQWPYAWADEQLKERDK